MFANLPAVGVIEPHSNIKRVEAVVDILADSPRVEMPTTSEDTFNLIEKDQAHLRFRLYRNNVGEDEAEYVEFHTEKIDLPRREINFFDSDVFSKKYKSKKSKSQKRAQELVSHAGNAIKYLKYKENLNNQSADQEQDTRIPGMPNTTQASAEPEEQLEKLWRRYEKAEESLNSFVAKQLGGYRAQGIGMPEFLKGLQERYDPGEVEEIFSKVENSFNNVNSMLSGQDT